MDVVTIGALIATLTVIAVVFVSAGRLARYIDKERHFKKSA